jgi:hypothetical protein
MDMPKVDSTTDAKPAADGNGEHHDYRRLFGLFGVMFRGGGSAGNVRAEACPFCGREEFYLNVTTGAYKCHHENNCGKAGNAYTFIRWVHKTALDATTDDDYRRLGAERGLPLQTLKRHDLAWHGGLCRWLVPFKSKEGEVLNLQRFDPKTGDKRTLPELAYRLYGLEALEPAADKSLFLCEGPWDAIALDRHLRDKKTRDRYDIVAAPSAGVFYPTWLGQLEGYGEVRLVYDNDKAGRQGQERIVKLARGAKAALKLLALKWPPEYPDGCDVRDLVAQGVAVVEFSKKHCVKVSAGGRQILFVRGDAIPEERSEWLWSRRLPFNSFVSFSGYMGTGKSLIARDLAARATAGLPMPGCEKGLDPFDVLYFTSEDSAAQVRDLVRLSGGDLTRLHVHDIASGTEPIDVLECLEEMEATINALGARLVILDALNSFVGGDISTDSKARHTLSGVLHALARRTGACVLGVRNWGRSEGGTASQKALGATSLSDVGRCVLNSVEVTDPTGKDTTRRWRLEFEKVSGAPPAAPVDYCVEDLSTGDEDAHLRRVSWGGRPEEVALAADLAAKNTARKGRAAGAPRLAAGRRRRLEPGETGE